MRMSRLMGIRALRIAIPFFCTLTVAHAQEREDTRRMLEMNVQRQAADRERDLLQSETTAPAGSTITIDGQTWQVEHSSPAVGQALYLSLQSQQWPEAQRFLNDYLTFADRDPLLVHYAQGLLARKRGDFSQSVAEFTALLNRQPGFLPARLELARTLFEDGQEREAENTFTETLESIDASDPKTVGVRKSIGLFRDALEQRQAWTGAFAFGPEWTDNVNRTSASQTCLLSISGQCYYERTLPKAISTTGISFDASVQRRIPIWQHHGLYIRSQLFGTQYRTHGDYNETTFSTQAGYSYRKGRHQIAVAPTFEYYDLGNDAFYGAWGAHAEWSYLAGSASLLKIESDYKAMRFRQQLYAQNFDGGQTSTYTTFYREVGAGVTLFGGIDFVDSTAEDKVNAYQQKGVRLGASVELPAGFQATVFSAYRQRDYGMYSPLLEMRRRDKEQNYTLVLKAVDWKVAGFVPLLTVRHNKVKSNVDWLYSYDRNDVSLKLEYAF